VHLKFIILPLRLPGDLKSHQTLLFSRYIFQPKGLARFHPAISIHRLRKGSCCSLLPQIPIFSSCDAIRSGRKELRAIIVCCSLLLSFQIFTMFIRPSVVSIYTIAESGPPVPRKSCCDVVKMFTFDQFILPGAHVFWRLNQIFLKYRLSLSCLRCFSYTLYHGQLSRPRRVDQDEDVLVSPCPFRAVLVRDGVSVKT
jgi:hypothetical protein